MAYIYSGILVRVAARREIPCFTMGLDGRHVVTLDPIHPVLLRLVRDVARTALEAGKPLHVVDATAARPGVLPFLVGVGIRHFCVPTVVLSEFQRALSSFTVERATRATQKLSRAACQADVLPIVDPFLRAYDEAESAPV